MLEKIRSKIQKINEQNWEAKLKKSGLPIKFLHVSLENFIVKKGLKEAFLIAQNFENNIRQNIKAGKGIIFIGKVGVGKTHLACSIAKQAIRSGFDVKFFSSSELLEEIRLSFNDEGLREKLKNIHLADLWILDDFMTERVSEWVKEKIFTLLSYRYSNSKSTIITTEFLIEEIRLKYDAFGKKLTSRLTEANLNEIVHIDAEDFRKTMGITS